MEEKKPSFPTHPRLVGKRVYLRPATAEDITNTYHWFLQSDPSLQTRSPHALLTASEAAENFRKREKSADEQLLVIALQKDNTPVGTIRFFNLNRLNRSVELGLLIDPDQRRHGYALEALEILSRYLYHTRDMNKLHAETSSANKATVKLLEKAGFKRDGVLRAEFIHDGDFADGYVYSKLRWEFDR